MERFVAIDFETANSSPSSACQVGIVTMENGQIVDEYDTLIRPPDNRYEYWNTKIHGIKAEDTQSAKTFYELADSILPRLENSIIVAHNASFDYKVLRQTMAYYGMQYEDYNLTSYWECTLSIYRKKGHKKNNLKACCDRYNIKLKHHDALSDARGCALLYSLRHQ